MLMQIKADEIHVWTLDLNQAQGHNELAVLSADEQARAQRLVNPLHQTRFIRARYGLRKILSQYTGIAAEAIQFNYTAQKKPFLKSTISISFNLSHSDHLAVYGISAGPEIGIDIERVKNSYDERVAARYFSAAENQALLNLSTQQRVIGFYRLWARKEAVVKALGQGLQMSLQQFSVNTDASVMQLTLAQKPWLLISLPIHDHFQAAVCIQQSIAEITYCRFF
jgi:4'-phosphopantetheinyl transferase